MERAFDWLPPIASADADAYEALRHWCRRMAEPVASHGKRSLRSIAAALGLPAMKLLRRKDKALALIVANLATAGATIQSHHLYYLSRTRPGFRAARPPP